jgi:hypothetical protein
MKVELRHYCWYRNLLRYSARHYQAPAFRAICLAVVTGSILRALAGALAKRSLMPIADYGRVIRLAGRALISGWRDEVALSGLRP